MLSVRTHETTGFGVLKEHGERSGDVWVFSLDHDERATLHLDASDVGDARAAARVDERVSLPARNSDK